MSVVTCRRLPTVLGRRYSLRDHQKSAPSLLSSPSSSSSARGRDVNRPSWTFLRFFSSSCVKWNEIAVLSSPVIVERLGDVVTIGINRPAKRNCVNLETGRLLREAFADFERDDELLVAVLHGIGGSFCAGFDLEELSKSFTEDDGSVATAKLEEVLSDESNGLMGPTRMMLSKPVVGAVTGYAVAGGMELALMCDLRVMEETAVMGVYNRRFGVPLIDGGTIRLPAIVGLSRALDLIMTGRSVSAKEAFEMGLANRIVSTGTGLGQAVNLARSMTKFPMECLKADRANAYSAVYGSSTGSDIRAKLAREFAAAKHVIRKESISGAAKFAQEGVGRHGKFALDTRETLERRRKNIASPSSDVDVG